MLKAYYVSDIDNEYGEVAFGDTPGQAKIAAQFANDGLCDANYTELRARRSPQFDKYAEVGKVPVQALFDDGFWFWCERCAREGIDKDNGAVVIGDEVICEECAKRTEGAAKTTFARVIGGELFPYLKDIGLCGRIDNGDFIIWGCRDQDQEVFYQGLLAYDNVTGIQGWASVEEVKHWWEEEMDMILSTEKGTYELVPMEAKTEG